MTLIGWIQIVLYCAIVAALVIAAIAMAAVFVGGGSGTIEQKMLALSQQWPLLIAVFLCYVVAALMATAVMRIYLIHDLTARAVASTSVHNITAAENVAALGAAADAIGEGLADSLEIFGF